jgi:hypothetical protein
VFAALERGWLRLSLDDFGDMDAVLWEDLGALAAKDSYFASLAREGKPDPKDTLKEKIRRAQNWRDTL